MPIGRLISVPMVVADGPSRISKFSASESEIAETHPSSLIT